MCRKTNFGGKVLKRKLKLRKATAVSPTKTGLSQVCAGLIFPNPLCRSLGLLPCGMHGRIEPLKRPTRGRSCACHAMHS
jgi:hypothetical protein